MSFDLPEYEANRVITIRQIMTNPTNFLVKFDNLPFNPDIVIVRQITYSAVAGDTVGGYFVQSDLFDGDNIGGTFNVFLSFAANAVSTPIAPNTVFLIHKNVPHVGFTFRVQINAAGNVLTDAGAGLTGSLAVTLEFVKLRTQPAQKVY